MTERSTTITLLPRGEDMVEIIHEGLILARAWNDGAGWKTGRLHALRGIHDLQRHECRSDALGQLVSLAMATAAAQPDEQAPREAAASGTRPRREATASNR